jgi:hypothetical protein
MALGPLIMRDIEMYLDDLRDATVNRDFSRADKIFRTLVEFLRPEGYVLLPDKKLIYRLEKMKGVSTGQ